MIDISASKQGKEILHKIISSTALLGYGQGENWIGCCRKRENFSLKSMKQTTNLFCAHFSQDSRKCTVVSSLIRDCFFPIDYSPKILKFAKPIEKKLIKDNLLHLDREHDGIESLSSPERFRIYSSPDIETLKNLSFTLMTNSRIFGHLFFVFDELNVIAYPHDETGFGFIAINGTTQNVDLKVSSFLLEASLIDNVESIYQLSRPTP
ncbi:MAG: hypothetical protein IPO40_13580 [Fibrobacteres bacterium]|nr:hypothetical protein [Fibrobacterota bacterium]